MGDNQICKAGNEEPDSICFSREREVEISPKGGVLSSENTKISDIANDKASAPVESNAAITSHNFLVPDEILDHVESCPAIFKNQQMGDPELTKEDKRTIAKNLLQENPLGFLNRFGPYLEKHHLNCFASSNNSEVAQYAQQLTLKYFSKNKKLQQKNRRYEALKRLEAEGLYFSETEMEKREPLLYHQLVGQYLSEKEKLMKNRQNVSHTIPTFSNFLIFKMEREEITALRNSQQAAEDNYIDDMSEDNTEKIPAESVNAPRWGDDWIDAENSQRQKEKGSSHKKKKVHLSSKEKALLLQEFKSMMHSKFLNGQESDFNYNDIDSNPDYDCLETWSQDEEDKYFDDESCDANICTDTGIEDY